MCMKFINKSDRPWGAYYVIHDEKNYKLKKIHVKPGERLSYQYHNLRSETWVVVKGSGLVTLNDKDIRLKYGDTITIPKLSRHRVFNDKKDDLIFIEVQTGDSFEEPDIVRVQDDYGR